MSSGLLLVGAVAGALFVAWVTPKQIKIVQPATAAPITVPFELKPEKAKPAKLELEPEKEKAKPKAKAKPRIKRHAKAKTQAHFSNVYLIRMVPGTCTCSL
jgi:hypothetical protein